MVESVKLGTEFKKANGEHEAYVVSRPAMPLNGLQKRFGTRETFAVQRRHHSNLLPSSYQP